MKKKISKHLIRTLLGASVLFSLGQAHAADGLKCTYTTSINDTFKVTRQDRPVSVYKTENTFGFSWYGRENYTDARWTFTFDVVDPRFVKMALRRVRYDDDMIIYVNGNVIFNGQRNGYDGFDANMELKNYFVKGTNTLEVRLLNNIPKEGRIEANFQFSEGGCEGVPLPRPIIPNLPDSMRCIENLVCTEGAGSKMIGGVEVSRDCWNWETKRTCFDFREDRSKCQDTPVNGGSCEVVSKECIQEREFNVNGNVFNGCVLYETKTRCTKPVDINSMTAAEQKEFNDENDLRKSLCKPVQTCVGNDCYITEEERDKPDEDMPFILALLELGRQAGTYFDPANMRLFSGISNKCRSMRGFGAMAACCEVKSPVATDSKGQKVTPTNANTFNNLYENVEKKYADPSTSYQEDYVQTGSNPYTYDALYKPNEAAYMLQGTGAMKDTEAGGQGLEMGGASTVTVMGYGWSDAGSATGDQQSFGNYVNSPNITTPDD